jgi:hypothetical protein
VQLVIPVAAAALNELLDATEVERLHNAENPALRTSRPTDGLFEPSLVERIQLLMGLSG